MTAGKFLFVAAAASIAAVTVLGGCASSPSGEKEHIIKLAGPEENWANFSGAVERDRVDVVADMVEQGISPNTIVRDGDPALVRAIRMDNAQVVKYLMGHKDTNVNVMSHLGESALMLASYKGDVELFKDLLAKGANLKASGWTSLHYAATNGHDEIVQMLIKLGANINAQTKSGVTPLYMAARKPDRRVVMTLLRSGAYRDLCNDKGESPADAAARAGDEELAKYLAVPRCANPSSTLQINPK